MTSETVTLVVDSRIRVRGARLPEAAKDELKREFTHENPARKAIDRALENLGRDSNARGVLWARAKSEPKFLPTWREDGGELSLPRGGMVRAREILEGLGFEVESIDERSEGLASLRHDYEHLLDLRDYQAEIVREVGEVEQGCVKSPTGSGKTTAMIAAAAAHGLPTLVIVHSTGLLEQWVRRLRVELGLAEKDVGVVGDGKFRIRPITVGNQQTCRRRIPELAPRFGFVVCDEVHLFAAKTFLALVDEFPARFRIGVSDDVRRKDRKEFLIYDVFGELIAKVDRKKLVDEGTIFDVEVRLFRTGFSRAWWRDLPEQERPLSWNRLIDEMSADEERNRSIVEVALAELAAGERVLAWTHRVAHSRVLAEMVSASEGRTGLFLGGDEQRGEFQRTLLGFLEGSVRFAAGTYKAVGAALDLPVLTRGIVSTPIHTNPPFINQVRGRICRTANGKDDAVVYVPWDEAVFGLAPVEKFSRIARSAKLLEGGSWVDARNWLRRERERRRAEREG